MQATIPRCVPTVLKVGWDQAAEITAPMVFKFQWIVVTANVNRAIPEVVAIWSAPNMGDVMARNVFATHSQDGVVPFAKFQDVQELVKTVVLMGFVTVLTTNVYVTQVH